MNANGELLNSPASAFDPAGTPNPLVRGVTTALRRVRNTLFNAAAVVGVSRAAHEFQMLSDEQLAKLGMTRAEIPVRLRAMLEEVRGR